MDNHNLDYFLYGAAKFTFVMTKIMKIDIEL